MVKMKMLSLHKTENVPDHVIEELKSHIMKIMQAVIPVVDGVNNNLNLSAMNHIMAMMVEMYISENPEEIKRAALTLAKGFLGNVKFYTGVDIFEEESQP
jgi:hypothetical protein